MLIKFLIAIFATIVLLIHTQPIGLLADASPKMTLSSSDFRQPRIQLVVAAGAGLVLLLVNTTLAVYKPRGMTPYGWLRQRERRTASQP